VLQPSRRPMMIETVGDQPAWNRKPALTGANARSVEPMMRPVAGAGVGSGRTEDHDGIESHNRRVGEESDRCPR
jgi:hypothetical protein